MAGRRRLVERRRAFDARTPHDAANHRRHFRFGPRRGGGVRGVRRNGHRPALVGSTAREALQTLTAWRSGGIRLSNYAAALLAKKQWFAANEPARAQRLRHVLYAKDFLIFRLTGECVTDPSSGPDATQWDDRALEHTASRGLVPRVAMPWQWAGALTPQAAHALGLPRHTRVAVGAHDGICANVGAGAAYPGAYAITLGTHAVVRAIRTDVPPGAFRFYDLPPDRHVIGGNAVMAGRAADWFLDLLFDADDRTRPRRFRALDRAAAQVDIGSRGVRFLPFLAGQVAPEARPGAALRSRGCARLTIGPRCIAPCSKAAHSRFGRSSIRSSAGVANRRRCA